MARIPVRAWMVAGGAARSSLAAASLIGTPRQSPVRNPAAFLPRGDLDQSLRRQSVQPQPGRSYDLDASFWTVAYGWRSSTAPLGAVDGVQVVEPGLCAVVDPSRILNGLPCSRIQRFEVA